MSLFTLKNKTVNFTNMHPDMGIALGAAKAILSYIGGYHLVVTSAQDSNHSKGKHHQENLAIQGEAVDIRSKEIKREHVPIVVAALKGELDAFFDIVLEDFNGPNEHIHIERDPKPGEALYVVGA